MSERAQRVERLDVAGQRAGEAVGRRPSNASVAQAPTPRGISPEKALPASEAPRSTRQRETLGDGAREGFDAEVERLQRAQGRELGRDVAREVVAREVEQLPKKPRPASERAATQPVRA